MKRFLLSSVMLLATGGAAFAFENDAVIQVPPMNPQFIQIDDPVFINNSLFDVTIPSTLGGYTVLYQTSDTLDYTNNGVMNGTAGFDFETFPSSVGQRHWANSFVNNGNGVGGGVINAVNIFAGENIFSLGGFSETARYPLNFENAGLATVMVRATNVVNSGLINMDNTGLIDIVGNSLDMRRGQMIMTGETPPSSLDYGTGGIGTNSSGWRPLTDFSINTAATPLFTNATGLAQQISYFGTTAYFESTNPTPDANNVAVWRIVFLLDGSSPNVTHDVYFNNGGFGDFNIQWTGTFRNYRTGGTDTNYFLLSDSPANRRSLINPFLVNNGIPAEFTFAQGSTPFFTGPSATPSFVNTPFPPAATNDFAFVEVNPEPLSLGTNQIVGGNPTNLPGRIQLTSSGSLDLSDVTISGPNYLKLSAPVNFIGNSNSAISAPYADLNLGSTNGSLVLSNLLAPNLPAWTILSGGIFGLGVGIEAFSGSYFFVTSNTPAGSTNAVTITNDVRILIVSSSLQPTTVASQKDLILHATDNLLISDAMTVFGKFFSDTKALTVTTNNPNAYSLFGSLTLTAPDLLWSASLPNLQYLTNWGTISTVNPANFADNMPDLLSQRSQATPYQAFVNYGQIRDEGAFVLAKYFANSGTIDEPFGDISLSITGSAINTNGTLNAPNGPISIFANNLFISNSIVTSGRALIFKTPCFISDGYAFGNQFGHSTNATLPNIVTNGNTFVTGGGVQFQAKPASGDLLGTTIQDFALSNLLSINVWPGENRGASPDGFAENTALGRLILQADPSPARFVFQGLDNNNALYVDSLQLLGGATNTDANGNLTAVTIQPGMKIYYAEALLNGVSIAEKLNGKNGGGFCWVSNYAGVYSSTNLSGTLYNRALVVSTHIDSDGDTIVNGNDTTPIPAGTFDVTNAGPLSCGSSGDQDDQTDTNKVVVTNSVDHIRGILAFHLEQVNSSSLSFKVAQGAYTGLFSDTNGVNPASSGSFSANVTPKGNFSGKLQLGANTYSFSKAFDPSGNFTGSISNKNLAPLSLTLHLVNNDEITGEVSDGSWTAQLLAFRSLKNASSFGPGKYSLLLSTDATNSTAASAGNMTGTVTLSKNGNIKWTGALPDGSKLSEKSALSKDGAWPLYSSLYGGNGSLIGWLQITNGTATIGGNAIWVMPANQNALYPNGLTNELDAVGSK